MLEFQVRRFVARSGIEEVVLTDRAGMPWFWPNVFVTSHYRNASKSPNTQAKVLRTIGMALLWARSRGRDLDIDLTDGDFLSMSDVEDLADFLSLPAEEQERRCKQSETAPVGNVIGLEAFRPNHRRLAIERAEVDNAEIATRVRWTALYIEWHLNRRIGSLDRHRAASESLRTVGPKVVDRLRQLAPRVASKSDDDVTLEGVDVEILRRAEEAMRPGSPDNPFTTDFVQARNYLIWRLDEATRHGEPAALIRDFAHLMGQSIGACGTRAECHQDAPRACLGCMKFDPALIAKAIEAPPKVWRRMQALDLDAAYDRLQAA